MDLQKARYFLGSAAKRLRGAGLACPSCGESRASIVDRKYFVTSLARCARCRLLFRAPTMAADESEHFYQAAYQQGFTTEMPSDAELACMLQAGFGPERDYGAYVEVLDALGCRPGTRIIDFGCSWGYGSWQLLRRGYEVQAFEVSQPRGGFAREKLGIDVVSSLEAARGPFDVFFSAHVLEHVPSVAEAVRRGMSLLRPGGLFVAFTPNGSAQFRATDPGAWHKLWGLVHPQLIDAEYYRRLFADRACLLASSPYDAHGISGWRENPVAAVELALAGPELLCVALR